MTVSTNVNSHRQVLFRIESCEATTSVNLAWNQVVEAEIELTGTTGTRTNRHLALPPCRYSAGPISGQCRRLQKTCALRAARAPKRGPPS